jgi:hypothetical protein
MLTLRSLAIAMAGAGVLAGLSVASAQACDNDRYPCPVVAQPQEAADAAARPPRKKASRAARHDEKARAADEKARAKAERQASQAPSQANAATPGVQGQAADSGSKKAGGLVPALNEEVGRDESPVAAAAAAWLVLPDTAGAGAQGAAGEQRAAPDDATPAVPANGVKMVDPSEVNELDLAAAPAMAAESSWLSYLLATLGAALAAASTVRFFFG